MNDTTRDAGGILVVGAGELGMAVLKGLLERRTGVSPGLAVLLRSPAEGERGEAARKREDDLRALGIGIVHGDLASANEDSLTSLFAPFPTVICCSGFVGGLGTQRRITAAVLKAGVQHYIPWQFGVDYDRVGRGSGQDVWDEQLDVRDMLRSQQQTRWTIISTGMFMSFLFEPSFGVVDLERGLVRALGAWTNELTLTTPGDVGRLTADILAARPPLLDRVIFVAGDTLSYRTLADAVERRIERPVDRVLSTTADLRRDLNARPDDAMAKYRLAFARDHGVAWPKAKTFNGRHHIPVTTIEDWLRHWRLSCSKDGSA